MAMTSKSTDTLTEIFKKIRKSKFVIESGLTSQDLF